MRKKNSYRWLIWIFLAVILIGVALWNILSPYIDRWQSTKDYEKLAEEYVSDESEPDDGKQKKKDWWSTDIKVEFDQLKTEKPDASAGYGSTIRMSLVSTILSCTPGTTKNICAKISMAISISPEVSFWKD